MAKKTRKHGDPDKPISSWARQMDGENCNRLLSIGLLLRCNPGNYLSKRNEEVKRKEKRMISDLSTNLLVVSWA